jgi:hypothetical protein
MRPRFERVGRAKERKGGKIELKHGCEKTQAQRGLIRQTIYLVCLQLNDSYGELGRNEMQSSNLYSHCKGLDIGRVLFLCLYENA